MELRNLEVWLPSVLVFIVLLLWSSLSIDSVTALTLEKFGLELVSYSTHLSLLPSLSRWRNNMMFSEDAWDVHLVVRRVWSSHDEFYIFLSHHGHMDRLFVSCSPPPKDFVKVNVDGNFMESSSFMGADDLIR